LTGIAFIGGKGPPPAFAAKLASGADVIAAADSGLAAAEAAGVKSDWIIGDMDSLDDEGRLAAYPPERVLRYPHDKDYTDTELAVRLLREKGCGEIWLAGGGGGRTDHLLAIRALFDRRDCPSRWVTAAEDFYLVRAGECFEGRTGKGGVVSVFPAGKNPWAASSSGLKWPLDGVAWKRGIFGISNVAETGAFSVTVHAGRFLVMTEIPK